MASSWALAFGPLKTPGVPLDGPSAPAALRTCCLRLHLGLRPLTQAAQTAYRRNLWRLLPLLALEGLCIQELVVEGPAAQHLWYLL